MWANYVSGTMVIYQSGIWMLWTTERRQLLFGGFIAGHISE
jgi:hypothetical protein